jgi:hypothetical protein
MTNMHAFKWISNLRIDPTKTRRSHFLRSSNETHEHFDIFGLGWGLFDDW